MFYICFWSCLHLSEKVLSFLRYISSRVIKIRKYLKVSHITGRIVRVSHYFILWQFLGQSLLLKDSKRGSLEGEDEDEELVQKSYSYFKSVGSKGGQVSLLCLSLCICLSLFRSLSSSYFSFIHWFVSWMHWNWEGHQKTSYSQGTCFLVG